MILFRRSGAALLAAAAIGGCSGGAPSPEPAEPSPTPTAAAVEDAFVEVALETGLDFVQINGMSGEFFLCEIMGPGVALFDYDDDGDLDVYVTQGHELGGDAPDPAARDRLFRNDLASRPDGSTLLRFVDVTETSGIEARGYGMGVTAGDVDNDGRVDLYVTNLGPNQLWLNNGDGTFRETAEQAGVTDPAWSVSAAFVDYDRDGWLDLYVGDYLDFTLARNKDCFSSTGVEDYCAPASYLPVPDRLYRNRGDGAFEDVTAAAGIARELGPALGVVTADFDLDGWIDLYVANDGKPNLLWMNRGDGTFENRGLLAGCALNEQGRAEASMGVDTADFDLDGDEDLFMSHLGGETNTIYVNDGQGFFSDRSVGTGLGPASQPFTGFGTMWFDPDNDGLLDILVVNGAVQIIESLRVAGDPYPLHQRNQFFRALPGGRYEEATDWLGASGRFSEVSRGAAFGDLDNDGDVDVIVGNNAGRLRLLLNRVGQDQSWVGLRLVGRAAPRPMPGTRVGVFVDDGRTLWRRVRPAGSYASANDPRVLVGLGAALGVLKVRAEWPGGRIEEWSGIEINLWHELREGSGTAVAS